MSSTSIKSWTNQTKTIYEVANDCSLREAVSEALAENVNLFTADLTKQDLSQIDMSGAACPRANFRDSRLVKSDFSGVDLTGAVFSGTDLYGADFSGANLTETFFYDVNTEPRVIKTIFQVLIRECYLKSACQNASLA